MAESAVFARRSIWPIVGILTLLWHAMLFSIPWSRLLPSNEILQPPRVDLVEVQPKQLQDIKRKWKERSLLLSKESLIESEEAPEDADYISDKNQKIDQEQRARFTDVLPQNQLNLPQTSSPPGEAQKGGQKKLPKLSQLGIPFRLDSQPSKKSGISAQPFLPPGVTAGGDQAILDQSLPQGAENLLNTVQSVYYSYYSRLYKEIAPLWQRRIRALSGNLQLSPGEYTTQVDVIFSQNGRLERIVYLRYSGVGEFDEAVEFAWNKIKTFPNPPRELLDSHGLIHTGWTFTVHVGRGGIFQMGR